jgi:hypothetical protein
MLVHVYDPSYSGGGDSKTVNVNSAQTNLVKHYFKNKRKNKKELVGMAQGVACLHNRCKALGLLTSTRKKQNKTKVPWSYSY